MPENAKIKQIQIDSTTYDIEPAAQTEGTAVTVVAGISGGGVNKTTKYLHSSTTTVAPNAHTHSVTVSGNTGAPGGTTPSTAVASGSHTHNVSLTSSGTTGTITYIESHTGASLGTPTSATAAPNAHTHSVTVSGTTGKNSGNAVSVINSITANSSSTTGDVAFISAHTNASLGTPTSATAAPNAHTHSVTVSGTTGKNSGSAVSVVNGISSTSTSSTGDILYINSHTNASLGTPTSATAAPNAHTHSITISGSTGANSGNAVSVLSGISSESTSATGDISYIASHTNASLGTPTSASAAPNAHTHSVTVSGNTGANSGDAVAAVTKIEGKSTSATGDVAYISGHTNASLGTPTSATAAPNSHTHSVTVSGNTGANSGTAITAITGYPNFSGGSATTSYLHATTGTAAPNAHTHSVTVSGNTSANSGDAVAAITSIAGNSSSATGDVPYIASHTNASLGTPTSATAAPNAHTHSVTVSGNTGANSGTNFNAITGYPNFSGGGATTKYLHATTDTAAPNAHTHSVTVSGNTGANSGDAVAAITSLAGNSSSATGDVPYIASHTNASLGTATSASAAPNAHTHSVTVSGTTGKNSGDAVAAVTSIAGNSTSATGDVPYLASHTNASLGTATSASVAPNAHTHSVTISGTTGKNSGNAVAAITALAAATTASTGDITYLSAHTNASLGTPTSASAAPNAHTHSVTVSGNTGGNSGNAVNAVTGYGSFSGGGATTSYLHATTDTAAPNAHTHSVTVSGNTGANSGNAITAVTGYGSFSGGSATTSYLHKTTDTAAPNSHTHSVTVSGNTGANSGNAVNAVTGYGSFGGGSGSLNVYATSTTTTVKTDGNTTRVPFLTAVASTGSVSGTGSGSAAPSGHTHYFYYSSDTGSPNDEGVDVVTGYPSFNGGSFYGTRSTPGSGLTARRTLTISHTGASLGAANIASVATDDHTHPYEVDGDSESEQDAAVSIISGVSYTAPTFTTNYLLHGHTAASLGNPTTAAAAPNSHTHSYGSSTTLTTSSNSGTGITVIKTLEGKSTSASGDIVYISAHTNASLGNPSTASVAPSGHTHSFSGTFTTSTNDGAGITVIKSLEGKSTSATGDVTFISAHTAASLGNPTTAAAAPHSHTHGFSGTFTTSTNNGTAVTAITGYPNFSGGGATTKYLHPSTTNAAPNEHTHGYGSSTPLETSGSNSTAITAITGYPNFSGGGSTTKYLHIGTTNAAPNEHTHSYGSSTALTTSGNSGTAITAITGYPNFSGGGSTTKYLHAGTTNAAPSGHTHSYGSSTPLTTGTNSGTGVTVIKSLAGNSSSATGDITFISAHTAASLGTATSASAAPGSHTHSFSGTFTTDTNNGTGITAITGYPSFSGGGSTTKYLHVGTTNAAPSGHTHSYGSSTALTTGTNSGTGVTVLTKVEGKSTSATGDVAYISSHTNASLGTATSASAAPSGHTHSYGSSTPLTTSGNSGSGITAITGYPNFSGGGATTSYLHTTTANAAPNGHTHSYGSSTALTTATNNGTAVTAITGYPSFSGGGSTTKYLHPSTTNAAPNGHTHSYGSATPVATGTNSGTGITAITGYPNFSGGGSGSAYLHASKTNAAPNEHTHDYGSSTPLTTGNNSGTGITAITGYPSFSGGSATTSYLHAGTTNAAPNEHTHSFGSSTALTTSTNSGSGVTAISGYPNFSGGSGTTKYLSASTAAPSATVNVASTTHVHSYGSSTPLTTASNSGTGVTVMNGVSSTTTAGTGDITYLENVTHTDAAVTGTVDVIKAE